MNSKNVIIEENEVEITSRKQTFNKNLRLICTAVMASSTILTIIFAIQLYTFHTQGKVTALIRKSSGFYILKIVSPEDISSLSGISSIHTYSILTSLLIGLVLLYLLIITIFHDIRSSASRQLKKQRKEIEKAATKKQDHFFLSRTKLDNRHSSAPVITDEQQ